MKTFQDLRDWATEQRSTGVEFVTLEDLWLHIYPPKLPGDEIQFSIRRDLPGEKLDIKFEEHPDAKSFWVFALPKEGAKPYPRTHEELAMCESVEKLKKVFPDGRFDYIVDALLTFKAE